MDKIERVINFLKKVWYERNSPLKKYINYKGKDPFQILISTILSLRTKDELTYPIANNLFKKISDVKDFAEISIEELEKLIYPVGFYKTKAKNIKNISKIIIEKYNGQVPNSLEEL
ncbi:MAG: endonuclease III domain-containing protein, partial [Brevinematia bacterium]